MQAQCPYATYKSEVVVNGNVLRYKRTYEITDILVPAQHLDEVRDFFHKIPERKSRRRIAPFHALKTRATAPRVC